MAGDRFVSGFVSILGRPNVGKSTLLNALLGEKVAIVSDKPQTTRTNIQGVLNAESAQVVFLDTPGIHKADTAINRRMMRSVEAALAERDLLLLVADCTRATGQEDEAAVRLVKAAGAPALLLLNKIDRLKDKSRLLPLIARYRELADFEEYLPISAATGEGLEELKAEIVKRLPEGPRYFPEDEITDQPLRFFAAELIREKALQETEQEVPHAVMVEIEQWEESPTLVRIAAAIGVERDGQKAILIGAKGTMLKQIGTRARQELEQVLGRKTYLELFVKVRPRWRQDPLMMNVIDWRT
ncbi:MAG: GTPase Era [Bryobacteraceae bacterium]|nr:GTPase Era [Bryobacteraceae bacterium]